MSKKRTMQIDVIEEVKGTQFMQCKLYIDGVTEVNVQQILVLRTK